MKAVYKRPANCQDCIDGFVQPDKDDCDMCRKSRDIEVEVISFGFGIFGTKAMVLLPNGELETVNTENLIIILPQGEEYGK